MSQHSTVPDRRRTPRTDVLANLTCTIETAPVAGRVREISDGGFAIETTEVPPAGIHRFVFQFDNLEPVTIVAEAIHSTSVSRPGSDTVYLSGFEFLPCSAATARNLTRLVERIATVCAA